MEILLGNPGEEERGGNCVSGGRNRWPMVSSICFQGPFLVNYILCVWVRRGREAGMRKTVLRFRVSWNEGSLTPCSLHIALFLPSICAKGIFLQVLLPGWTKAAGEQAEDPGQVRCHSPFLHSEWVFMQQWPCGPPPGRLPPEQIHTKGTCGQEDPPPGLLGDKIHKWDPVGIILLKLFIWT